ncbi:hypothetical protein GGQ20_002333 [Salinibacter ruber]|uniref:SIR2 family protein n=1 Tax=Salinibacter ruber TaxID=146919 RepID=UPI002168A5DD|nr:SIR2 family protein [Salinibacter ruber]MCS3701011.1 hypothetical protein [Salinibacter ruber]
MDEQELVTELHGIIDQYRAAPFLFVGTGLSRRYLGADDWRSLLKHYARETEESFDKYVNRAKREADDETNKAEVYPKVGTLIDEAFFEIWHERDKYAEKRDRLRSEGRLPKSPLKYEVAEEIRRLSEQDFPVRHPNEPDEHEEELRKLRQATVDGIITTNYDLFLDRIFDDYEVYVGQEELIFEEKHSIAEIYKIHGSCDDHESLVLTEDDYEEFSQNNQYLAAKLITIFLEHPVVFLGYSIGDPNVREVLRQVIRCLDAERLDELSNRLVFVEWNEEPSPPEIATREFDIMEGGKSLQVTRVSTHSFVPVYDALRQTDRQMSAKLMRRMKEQVYQLALTQEPQEQIYAVDIEEADSHDEVDFVMGVGVHERISRVGATGIGVDELFEDLVTEGNRFDHMAEMVVTDTVREWLQPGRKLVPVYKYMARAGFLDEEGLPNEEEIPGKVVGNALLPQSEFQYPATETSIDEYRHQTVGAVIEEDRQRHLIAAYLTLVRHPNTAELWGFIQDNQDLLQSSPAQSYMKKLLCIYDREHYGPGFSAIEQRRDEWMAEN